MKHRCCLAGPECHLGTSAQLGMAVHCTPALALWPSASGLRSQLYTCLRCTVSGLATLCCSVLALAGRQARVHLEHNQCAHAMTPPTLHSQSMAYCWSQLRLYAGHVKGAQANKQAASDLVAPECRKRIKIELHGCAST